MNCTSGRAAATAAAVSNQRKGSFSAAKRMTAPTTRAPSCSPRLWRQIAASRLLRMRMLRGREPVIDQIGRAARHIQPRFVLGAVRRAVVEYGYIRVAHEQMIGIAVEVRCGDAHAEGRYVALAEHDARDADIGGGDPADDVGGVRPAMHDGGLKISDRAIQRLPELHDID